MMPAGGPSHPPAWRPPLVAPAVAAAPAAVAAPAAAAAAAPVGLGPGLVDRQGPPLDLLAVQRGDGGLGLLVGGHLDEAEPLGPARVAVDDHLRRLHTAVRPEHLLQITVADAVGQVAHVQLLAHERASRKDRPGEPQPPAGR